MIVETALADLSSGVVVVQVHECPGRVAVLGASLSGVDERLGESAAVGDIVRAAGPLEAVGGARSFDSSVAAAAVQQAGAAGSRHGVCDRGRRDGVYECRLSGTCNDRACHSQPTPTHPRCRR